MLGSYKIHSIFKVNQSYSYHPLPMHNPSLLGCMLTISSKTKQTSPGWNCQDSYVTGVRTWVGLITALHDTSSLNLESLLRVF